MDRGQYALHDVWRECAVSCERRSHCHRLYREQLLSPSASERSPELWRKMGMESYTEGNIRANPLRWTGSDRYVSGILACVRESHPRMERRRCDGRGIFRYWNRKHRWSAWQSTYLCHGRQHGRDMAYH